VAEAHGAVRARHEAPARPRGRRVGDGGRLPFVRDLDARLSSRGADLDAVGDAELWLNRGEAPRPGRAPAATEVGSNVRFTGRVPDAELAGLYRDALCLVAPAFREDYGLTAIEAMAFGRPVVVASDGGGLTAVVDDGVNGFRGGAVGPGRRPDAVRRLAETTGSSPAGWWGWPRAERAAEFTWDRRCASSSTASSA